jgi:hypothetical protein
MYRWLWLAATAGLVSGCVSYESAYERAVYDHEPVYCYQSLADVMCGRQPSDRDQRRLVNYFGPAPGKYAAPPPPRLAKAAAPPRIKAYHRDPEPPPVPPQSPAAAAAPTLPSPPLRAQPQAAPADRAPGEERGPLHLGPAATAEPRPLP